MTRTRDFEQVRRAFTNPRQYRMASDDSTPDAEHFEVNRDERIIYLDTGEGIITLIPQNAACFELHLALDPSAFGSRSRELLRAAIAWAWSNTPARRIVASIPAYNRLAIRLGRDAGMIDFGRNPASFLRDGRLYDQVLIGISR